MKIIPKEQLINTLNELYNLIRVTSGGKYDGLNFIGKFNNRWEIVTHKSFMRVSTLKAYYNSSKCHIVCKIPSETLSYKEDEINRFNDFMDFLKDIPCIKVIPDKYLKYVYYLELEDL